MFMAVLVYFTWRYAFQAQGPEGRLQRAGPLEELRRSWPSPRTSRPQDAISSTPQPRPAHAAQRHRPPGPGRQGDRRPMDRPAEVRAAVAEIESNAQATADLLAQPAPMRQARLVAGAEMIQRPSRIDSHLKQLIVTPPGSAGGKGASASVRVPGGRSHPNRRDEARAHPVQPRHQRGQVHRRRRREGGRRVRAQPGAACDRHGDRPDRRSSRRDCSRSSTRCITIGRDRKKGFGLGLSIARRWPGSSEGRSRSRVLRAREAGSPFLPGSRRRARRCRPLELRRQRRTQWRLQKRVLIVEDDASSSQHAALLLARQGWQVEQAAIALGGFEQLRSAPFDSVVLDLMLPDGNGGGPARAFLRSSGQQTRVAVTTGVMDSPLTASEPCPPSARSSSRCGFTEDWLRHLSVNAYVGVVRVGRANLRLRILLRAGLSSE